MVADGAGVGIVYGGERKCALERDFFGLTRFGGESPSATYILYRAILYQNANLSRFWKHFVNMVSKKVAYYSSANVVDYPSSTSGWKVH